MYTKYLQIYPTFQQTFVYILHKIVEMLRYILFTFRTNFVYQLYTYKIYTYFLFGMLKLFDLPIANREARKSPLHFYRQPLTFKRKPWSHLLKIIQPTIIMRGSHRYCPKQYIFFNPWAQLCIIHQKVISAPSQILLHYPVSQMGQLE